MALEVFKFLVILQLARLGGNDKDIFIKYCGYCF